MGTVSTKNERLMPYRSDPDFIQAMWEESLTGAAVVSGDGKFLAANPMFCNICEYTEYELLDKRWQDITHPDDLKADEQMAMEVATGKRTNYIMYKRYLTKMGRIVKIKLKVTKVEKDGTFAFFLSQVAGVEELAPPRNDHYPAKNATASGAFANVFKDNFKFILTAVAAMLGSVAYIVAEVIKHLQ